MQAERFGYFVVDPDTKKGDVIVMNRILNLREDKEKVNIKKKK